MQDIISTYLQSLKVKDSTGYELAARECKEYFDGRGIEHPTADDWKTFEAEYPAIYQSKRGKEISQSTLQQNYVARGKAYYRWCMEQAGVPEGTPSLFPDMEHALHEQTEQATQPAEAMKTVTRKEAQPVRAERSTEKQLDTVENVRVNFLLSKDMQEALQSVALLKDKTLTAILTEAVEQYISQYADYVARMREVINAARIH